MKIEILVVFFLIGLDCCLQAQSQKVLIFSKTEGFRHKSIEVGVERVKTLCSQLKVESFATEDAKYFNTEDLKNYDAVVFLNTTMDVLDTKQQMSFQYFIRSGKGFLGIHAATDTEYNWPWYGKLVGAYFNGHPPVQTARIHFGKDHAFCGLVDSVQIHEDEWYNFKFNINNFNVLYTIDESSYKGGTNGDYHPMTWYHEFEGGRSFYTGMGHTIESFYSPILVETLICGLQYVLYRN